MVYLNDPDHVLAVCGSSRRNGSFDNCVFELWLESLLRVGIGMDWIPSCTLVLARPTSSNEIMGRMEWWMENS